jgi:hypothetical protein
LRDCGGCIRLWVALFVATILLVMLSFVSLHRVTLRGVDLVLLICHDVVSDVQTGLQTTEFCCKGPATLELRRRLLQIPLLSIQSASPSHHREGIHCSGCWAPLGSVAGNDFYWLPWQLQQTSRCDVVDCINPSLLVLGLSIGLTRSPACSRWDDSIFLILAHKSLDRASPKHGLLVLSKGTLKGIVAMCELPTQKVGVGTGSLKFPRQIIAVTICRFSLTIFA